MVDIHIVIFFLKLNSIFNKYYFNYKINFKSNNLHSLRNNNIDTAMTFGHSKRPSCCKVVFD